MKIHSAGAELFHADRRMDGWTERQSKQLFFKGLLTYLKTQSVLSYAFIPLILKYD
jgi:hypothetical protein